MDQVVPWSDSFLTHCSFGDVIFDFQDFDHEESKCVFLPCVHLWKESLCSLVGGFCVGPELFAEHSCEPLHNHSPHPPGKGGVIRACVFEAHEAAMPKLKTPLSLCECPGSALSPLTHTILWVTWANINQTSEDPVRRMCTFSWCGSEPHTPAPISSWLCLSFSPNVWLRSTTDFF